MGNFADRTQVRQEFDHAVVSFVRPEFIVPSLYKYREKLPIGNKYCTHDSFLPWESFEDILQLEHLTTLNLFMPFQRFSKKLLLFRSLISKEFVKLIVSRYTTFT